MISDFDEDNKCLAFWSCADLGSSTIQKGAWLMCQSPDLDQEVIVNMAEKIANASDIELSDFIWTEYETCL
ncbi:uncharacterized protein CEXT_378711 [Caerostris extrusa]|nr:uncharacterized protein CEXT_378711 [Caerostris extrusa]